MSKIQQITVKDPTSLRPSVQLTIADCAEVDEATVYLNAAVTIDRERVSLEDIELSVLDEILTLVADARVAVHLTKDEVLRKQEV